MHYEHILERGEPDAPTLVLLHGTGGDERQLLELARAAWPGATLLSLRGTVLENGLLRFFRRHADGVLDEDDLREKALATLGFLSATMEGGRLPRPIAVGYSNGANLAAAMLFLAPRAFQGAVLMRAVSPFATPIASDLGGLPVLMLSGRDDAVIDPARTLQLERDLSAAGAHVEHRTLPADHDLSGLDDQAIADWLRVNAVER